MSALSSPGTKFGPFTEEIAIKILVIEDEKKVANFIKRGLEEVYT
jgi:hypothetical protein